jgi:hypothetical protein
MLPNMGDAHDHGWGVLESYLAALRPWHASGVLDDFQSFTRDLVVSEIGSWCGSAIHGTEQEGRRPFTAIT